MGMVFKAQKSNNFHHGGSYFLFQASKTKQTKKLKMKHHNSFATKVFFSCKFSCHQSMLRTKRLQNQIQSPHHFQIFICGFSDFSEKVLSLRGKQKLGAGTSFVWFAFFGLCLFGAVEEKKQHRGNQLVGKEFDVQQC